MEEGENSRESKLTYDTNDLEDLGEAEDKCSGSNLHKWVTSNSSGEGKKEHWQEVIRVIVTNLWLQGKRRWGDGERLG